MQVKTRNGTADMRALWWEDGTVRAIDQRKLPHLLEIVTISTHDEIASAISDITIRGAPSICAAGAYGMALAARNVIDLSYAARTLKSTMPTASVTVLSPRYAPASLNT